MAAVADQSALGIERAKAEAALHQEESLLPHVDFLLSKPPGLRELQAALKAVARLA